MAAVRTSGPVDAAARRRALMDLVRSTGARGGRIDPHRAIATMHLHRRDVLGAAALAVAFTGVFVAGLGLVSRFWTAIFTLLAGPLGMGGVAVRIASIGMVADLAVPYFTVRATEPSRAGWWITAVVTAVMIGVSLLMRARWLPLGYTLRFAAAIQLTALLYFAVAPGRFPYDLGAYVSGMMQVGAILVAIVPVVFGLTFYVIDVGWTRKIGLTLAVMGHLLVLVPLQYALQSVVIVHASLVVLPLSFVMFGLLPEIMVLVALFGWGMSWRSGRARGRRQ